MRSRNLKDVICCGNDNTEALRNQVFTLTAQNTKLERNLNAKQVFCETIVTENEAIKGELQSLKDDRILKVRDMKKELGDLIRTQPEVREIMNQVYDNQDGELQVILGFLGNFLLSRGWKHVA